jgi:hypothetical protein
MSEAHRRRRWAIKLVFPPGQVGGKKIVCVCVVCWCRGGNDAISVGYGLASAWNSPCGNAATVAKTTV